MRSCYMNCFGVAVMCGLVAALGWPLMGHSGVDTTLKWCFESIVFSLACILIACIIYADRTGWKAKYQEKFTKHSNVDEFITVYRSRKSVQALVVLALIIAVIVLAGYSLTNDQNYADFFEVYHIIWEHIMGVTFEVGTDEWIADIIVCQANLPRVVVTIVAGAGLAVGGAVMQSVLRNPLADPYTTGISSGAVLGVSVAMVLGISFTDIGNYGVIANAFLFSLIPAFVLIMVSKVAKSSAVVIILIGTALSYIFSAFSTILMLMADETTMDNIFRWTVGSLRAIAWDSVPVMLVVTVACSVFLYFSSYKLNLMMAGDDDARALGLDVDKFRIVCLIMLSLMTASVVSYTGIIGFLGLLSPHIIRLLMGSDSKLVIPASALFGSALLLLADILSRDLADKVMPVGVVMSFIGGPLFLLIVLKTKKEVIT